MPPKPISGLDFGFSDAENYKRREYKNLFNNLFIKEDGALEEICRPTTSFIIGDKGTGKTAYAVYFCNNAYKKHIASIRYIRETDYKKFITLKNEKHLDLSDYASIWKVIIYLLIAEQIYERESRRTIWQKAFRKIAQLHRAIEEYHQEAFSPEIIHALQFIEEVEVAAKLIAKHAQASGAQKTKVDFSESRFQTKLLFIQKKFESAFRALKLDRNHLLFIDGIDIRPNSVPYTEYEQCIRGLANAIWEINNDFFPSIRDSPGRIRVILLLRPDIFASLGLQNQNTKIRDNSVILDWRTNYRDYRNSRLFRVADRLLSNGQEHGLFIKNGDAWNHYFPYNSPSKTEFKSYSSFIGFIRFSYHRPRDIVTMMKILQENFTSSSRDQSRSFSSKDFDHTGFRRLYADYLLGEIKDQLSFYYAKDDYEKFLGFFAYLNGKHKFSYDEYNLAYQSYLEALGRASQSMPLFMNEADEFLQFLYELNVISYVEYTEDSNDFIHWCFRERSYSNISPKVKPGHSYEIFYGLRKALNLGKKISNVPYTK